MNHETLEDIDNHILTWTDKIKDATDRRTPTIQYRVLPGAQPNRYIKKLQRTYKRLMTIIRTYGPNLERYRLLRTLQQDLKDEYDRLTRSTWDNIIQTIDTDYDPRVFFKTIKRLMENSTTISPYIIHNDERLYDPQRQEPVFRQFWQNVFTDEDPDNNNFDYDSIQQIKDSMNDRINRTVPSDNSGLTRLDNNQCPPITTELTDVKATLH